MFRKLKYTFYFLLIATWCLASPSNQMSIPNSFSPQTTISSSAVNANFNEIQTKFNVHTHTDITQLGVITTGTWAASTIQTAYIAQGAGAITGEVKMWAGTTANIPTSFLACDGSAVSRTTYSALFAIIGTNYGVGDGATTFNLPDFNSSLFVRGSSTAGTSGGVDTHTHTAGTLAGPAHTHNVSMSGWGTVVSDVGNGTIRTTVAGIAENHATGDTTSGSSGTGAVTGTSGSSSNVPAFRTAIYIIRI